MCVAGTPPHRGNLALELGPDVVDSRLNRDSYDPSRVVVEELHKEANIEAATSGVEYPTGLPVVMLGCKFADGILVNAIYKLLLSCALLLICERVRVIGRRAVRLDSQCGTDKPKESAPCICQFSKDGYDPRYTANMVNDSRHSLGNRSQSGSGRIAVG